jgi:hypothetical protein
MYSPTGMDTWAQQPYMMVGVPMMGGQQGSHYAAPQVDPRAGMHGVSQPAPAMMGGYYAGPAGGGCAGECDSGLKYASDSILMAAGQYREVRPTLSPVLMAAGGRFQCDPPELPSGLQLDPSTGIIWGTPAAPATEDPAGAYRDYGIFYSSSVGTASTKIGLKVVNFHPHNFRIAHVAKLERNKYMVIVDTQQKQ